MLEILGSKIKTSLEYMLPPDAGRSEKLFAILNLSVPVLLGIFLFSYPLPLTSVTEASFFLSLSVVILLLIFKKTDFKFNTPLTIPFALFFAWAVFGLPFALDIKNTLHDLRAHLLEHIILFFLLVNYFRSAKKLEIISWIIIISATIFCIGAVVDFYFIKGFAFRERLGVLTFREIPTDYIGFVTVFAITLALNYLIYKKEAILRALLALCLVILTVTTLLTQSKGTLLGLFISLLILSFNNKKFLIPAILLPIIALSIPVLKDRFDINNLIQNERIAINRLTIEIIREHPLFGIGFGMQTYGNKDLVDLEKLNSRLSEKYRQKIIITAPHNTFLDVAVRTGIIGAFLFLGIIFVGFLMLWKMLKSKEGYFRSWAICLSAGFVSFLAPSSFADTTFGAPVVVFYTMLAMITILCNLYQKEEKARQAPCEK